MRFGVIKTIVESKLTKSFKDKSLKEDMRLFNTKLLSNKDFCKMMNIYDNLNENKGLDKESANYLIDDLIKEFNSVNLDKKTIKFIQSWTNDVVKENRYKTIDDLIYGDTLKPEKKSIARKSIVESLNKEQVIKENKFSKVPISSLLKIANNTAKKHLENLNESDRQKVLDIISVDEKELSTKFEKIKEDTINKLNSLLTEGDEELSKKLIETKERVSNSKVSKNEYVKLWTLNQNL